MYIEALEWDKYAGRSDVKRNYWFKFHNDFFMDSSLYETEAYVKLAYILILSKCSLNNSKIILVSPKEMAGALLVDPKLVLGAVHKLSEINKINYFMHRLPSRLRKVVNPPEERREEYSLRNTKNRREKNVLTHEKEKKETVIVPEIITPIEDGLIVNEEKELKPSSISNNFFERFCYEFLQDMGFAMKSKKALIAWKSEKEFMDFVEGVLEAPRAVSLREDPKKLKRYVRNAISLEMQQRGV